MCSAPDPLHRGKDAAADHPRVPPAQDRPGRAARGRHGTALPLFIFHWLLAAAVVVSLLTGLRIAADAPDAGITRALGPWLPQGEVFSLHLASAGALLFATVGYGVWLALAGRPRRLALSPRRLRALATGGRARASTSALVLIWLGLLWVAGMLVSGTLLYVNPPSFPEAATADFHRVLAWCLLGFLVLHVLAHLWAGGWRSLLRMLWPSGRHRAGALAAAGAAAAALGGALWLDRDLTRTLTVHRVDEPPRVDGDLQDPAWAAAPPTVIATRNGANLPRGRAEVTLRAVHDGEYAYFLASWPDATRSRKHWPLLKTEEGWRVLNEGLLSADEDRFYEDKFSIMLARSGGIAGDRSIHLGATPLGEHPGPPGGRGLHYTTEGQVVDVWHWKSLRTGEVLHKADDDHFGPPRPSRSEWKRYTGGYYPDVICQHALRYTGRDWTPNPDCGVGSVYNWDPPKPRERVTPARLPRDPGALPTTDTVDLSPDVSDEGFGYLRWEDTVPYSVERDTYPVGTLMPSILVTGPLAPGRDDIDAHGDWHQGRWHLELRRRLDTGSEEDIPIADGVYLWVAVFNHTQTRHSYHLKPLRLRLR